MHKSHICAIYPTLVLQVNAEGVHGQSIDKKCIDIRPASPEDTHYLWIEDSQLAGSISLSFVSKKFVTEQ